MKDRHCNKCDKDKKLSDFPVDVSNKHGRAYRCKKCCNEVRRLTRKRPDVRRKNQNYHLTTKYGITLEQQESMLLSQEGKCAICGTSEPGGKYNKWQTDHDHKETNVVRGLLCYRCNTGLGNFKDSPLALFRAAIYLTRGVPIEDNKSVL